MDDKLQIKLIIAERPYPMKIERADEQRLREVAKTINDTIATYRKRFANTDTQDLLAMVTLHFLARSTEQEKTEQVQVLVDELKTLTHEIDAYLTSIA